jgi:ribosome assembly protein RRB1
MLTVNDAHTNDINVISWNKMEPLIVSGGDDGYLKVWDLRQFKVRIREIYYYR